MSEIEQYLEEGLIEPRRDELGELLYHGGELQYGWTDKGKEMLRQEREVAAKRIDPQTCERWYQHVNIADPYGEYPEVEEVCVGRMNFVGEPLPEGGPAVLEYEVRALHPEISDDEWRELMDAAWQRWQDA